MYWVSSRCVWSSLGIVLDPQRALFQLCSSTRSSFLLSSKSSGSRRRIRLLSPVSVTLQPYVAGQDAYVSIPGSSLRPSIPLIPCPPTRLSLDPNDQTMVHVVFIEVPRDVTGTPERVVLMNTNRRYHPVSRDLDTVSPRHRFPPTSSDVRFPDL